MNYSLNYYNTTISNPSDEELELLLKQLNKGELMQLRLDDIQLSITKRTAKKFDLELTPRYSLYDVNFTNTLKICTNFVNDKGQFIKRKGTNPNSLLNTIITIVVGLGIIGLLFYIAIERAFY